MSSLVEKRPNTNFDSEGDAAIGYQTDETVQYEDAAPETELLPAAKREKLVGDYVNELQQKRDFEDSAEEFQSKLKERAKESFLFGAFVDKAGKMIGVLKVIAVTAAIERLNPEVDVIIELGGEDAKITYLHPVPEQRMNGTCAGGTGAFIDQMATLLKVDAAGLDSLAAGYTNLYPIASRCGVFAKTDVQPLLNQGAAHSDIAASVFQAVATQTVAGLACGTSSTPASW